MAAPVALSVPKQAKALGAMKAQDNHNPLARLQPLQSLGQGWIENNPILDGPYLERRRLVNVILHAAYRSIHNHVPFIRSLFLLWGIYHSALTLNCRRDGPPHPCKTLVLLTRGPDGDQAGQVEHEKHHTLIGTPLVRVIRISSSQVAVPRVDVCDRDRTEHQGGIRYPWHPL